MSKNFRYFLLGLAGDLDNFGKKMMQMGKLVKAMTNRNKTKVSLKYN